MVSPKGNRYLLVVASCRCRCRRQKVTGTVQPLIWVTFYTEQLGDTP